MEQLIFNSWDQIQTLLECMKMFKAERPCSGHSGAASFIAPSIAKPSPE